MLNWLKLVSALLLSLGLTTGTNAQENESNIIEFELIEKGEPVPYDAAIIDEIEFKRYETNEILAHACFTNEVDLKGIIEVDKKLRKIYRVKTALTVLGGIKNIVGLGMYLSGVKEFKKWGAGLMVLGTVEISIGISI